MASTAQSKAREFRGHWVDEMNGAATYRALAERAHGEQRDIFLELAEAEERHARHWAKKLVDLGEPEPGPGDYREDLRTRVISWLARHLGPSAVLPIVERAEIADAGHYDNVPEATVAMATDERIHARVLSGLTPSTALSGIRRGERWHRGDSSGALRAAIFGVNDGLVSEEIETMPEEEANELALIYRAKGIGREDAEAMAARIMRDPSTALDTMAREELGLNPEELGSPTRVAASSFTAFAIGAVVPVLAWVFSAGAAAFVTSIILSALALFLVGAGISLLTGRSAIRSGIRQLLVGGAAAIATFGIGRLIGVSVS